jgi:hypothetical protein
MVDNVPQTSLVVEIGASTTWASVPSMALNPLLHFKNHKNNKYKELKKWKIKKVI